MARTSSISSSMWFVIRMCFKAQSAVIRSSGFLTISRLMKSLLSIDKLDGKFISEISVWVIYYVHLWSSSLFLFGWCDRKGICQPSTSSTGPLGTTDRYQVRITCLKATMVKHSLLFRTLFFGGLRKWQPSLSHKSCRHHRRSQYSQVWCLCARSFDYGDIWHHQ